MYYGVRTAPDQIFVDPGWYGAVLGVFVFSCSDSRNLSTTPPPGSATNCSGTITE